MIELEKMRKSMKESSETIEATKVKIDKIDKIRKRPVYTVRFRVLTLTAENSLEKVALDDGETKRLSKKTKLNAPPTEANKTRRNHIVNGKVYTQIGRLYSFETKEKWFWNNFKSKGTKNDIIIRATRGEKGSRWSRAVGPVMVALEEIGANHIIGYMDACVALGLAGLVFKRPSRKTRLVKNGFFWFFLVAAAFQNPG
jgi:hypothetical protein